ncbi:hypothetical protein ACLB2K_020560 [Fragaria x ananassa]
MHVSFQSVNFVHVDVVHASAAVGIYSRAFNLATYCKKPRIYPDLIKWHPPLVGVMKLNFDGFITTNHVAASFVRVLGILEMSRSLQQNMLPSRTVYKLFCASTT